MAGLTPKQEAWPIDRPQPYPANPRQITDKAIAKVATSIREFGFQQPIVVDTEGVIIAGHTRLAAAKQLQLEQVPVIVADLPEAKVRAYRLADNRTAQETSWLDDLLGDALTELDAISFDLSTIGFDDEELADLMGQAETLEAWPELAAGDRETIQQMTFTLHDDQVETVKEAITGAKGMGAFGDTGNENSNGNALARICECFLTYGASHAVS